MLLGHFVEVAAVLFAPGVDFDSVAVEVAGFGAVEIAVSDLLEFGHSAHGRTADSVGSRWDHRFSSWDLSERRDLVDFETVQSSLAAWVVEPAGLVVP